MRCGAFCSLQFCIQQISLSDAYLRNIRESSYNIIVKHLKRICISPTILRKISAKPNFVKICLTVLKFKWEDRLAGRVAGTTNSVYLNIMNTVQVTHNNTTLC